jgi:hypothetical protein
MARMVPVLAFGIVWLSCPPAHAIWMRSESVEWWTSVSDIVVVGEVSSTKEIDDRNEHQLSQVVAISVTATLKGDRQESLRFRQDHWTSEQESLKSIWYDPRLRPKDRLIVFFARPASGAAPEALWWVNLGHPDANLAKHAPYDNDGKLLGTGESVLDLVKRRIAKQSPSGGVKKRGVIVPFPAYRGGLMRWDFVRTADPDFKPVLVKQLRAGDVESAIYNLVSYPGKETAELIRPFLKDTTTSEAQVSDRKAGAGHSALRAVTYYPFRQTAYQALRLMGETPARPDWFADEITEFLCEIGFESTTYFPYGDWKRIDK